MNRRSPESSRPACPDVFGPRPRSLNWKNSTTSPLGVVQTTSCLAGVLSVSSITTLPLSGRPLAVRARGLTWLGDQHKGENKARRDEKKHAERVSAGHSVIRRNDENVQGSGVNVVTASALRYHQATRWCHSSQEAIDASAVELAIECDRADHRFLRRAWISRRRLQSGVDRCRGDRP